MHQRKKAILWYLIQGGSEKCRTNTTMNTCPTSNELPLNNNTLNNSSVTSAKYNSILWPKLNSTDEGNPIDSRNRTNRVNLVQWTRWGLCHGTFHFLSAPPTVRMTGFRTGGLFFSFKKPAKFGSIGQIFQKGTLWISFFKGHQQKFEGHLKGGGEVVDTNGTPPYICV